MFSLSDAERITPRLVWLVTQHAIWSLRYVSVNYLFDTVTGGDVGCGPIREVWVVLPTEQEKRPGEEGGRERGGEGQAERVRVGQQAKDSTTGRDIRV